MHDYRDIIGGEPSAVPDRANATLVLARYLTEAVRGLNHTTAADSGLRYASTVYSVLGAISTAADRLDQTLQQLKQFLIDEHQAGRLAHDDHHEPSSALAAAHLELDAARAATHDLAFTTGSAQAAIGDIHTIPSLAGAAAEPPAPTRVPTVPEIIAGETPYPPEQIIRTSVEDLPSHHTDRPPEAPARKQGRGR